MNDAFMARSGGQPTVLRTRPLAAATRTADALAMPTMRPLVSATHPTTDGSGNRAPDQAATLPGIARPGYVGRI